MRVSQSTKLRAIQARDHFQRYGNLSKTARELGVHRSTLDRWRKEGLLEPGAEDSSDQDEELTLDHMINKALKVIDGALSGEKVTPNQIRAAIEVTKASNSFRAQALAEEAKVSLADLIAAESVDDSD